MKIVFMGTPDFAAKALEKLYEAGHEIVLVVTQPDKEKGRGKVISQSPVKEFAVQNSLSVFQPVKLRETESVEYLKKFPADICVVAAFGQILSEEVLNMYQYGCINIHASLLPKYRGAAPIQWSILNGDENTGVTIMQMEKGLDTGDMLIQRKVKIEDDDTGESLFDKLTEVGADLIVEVLPLIEKGKITPVKQNDEESNYAGKITKEMGLINFDDDAAKIERYVRGLNSWPSAYTYLNGKTLKIWKAAVAGESKKVPSGTITAVNANSFVIQTGKGAIEVSEIQLEGKKRMSVHDFLLGYKIEEGTLLGK